jgi:hypothetical protein
MMRDLVTELTKNTYFLPIAHRDLYLRHQWGNSSGATSIGIV